MIATVTKLDIYEFGRQLLETKDLDPVYVILHEVQLEPWELQRWLMSYWCFYHSGTASWITDGANGYWDRMEVAARSKDYPRCHERRHFRGAAAIKSVAWLRERGLVSLFEPLLRPTAALADLMHYVQTWYLFGPWIAFKVADMLERLGLCQVKFDDGAMFLFDSPRNGAVMLWEYEHGVGAKNGEAQSWAVERIMSELGQQKAPPRYERRINSQEAETILCKWKSYMGGHYRIGEDIEATKSGLLRFGKCLVSQRLLQAGERGGLW